MLTDERTQVHIARSSLMVTHPSNNRGRRCWASVNMPLRYSLGRHVERLIDNYIMIALSLNESDYEQLLATIQYAQIRDAIEKLYLQF